MVRLGRVERVSPAVAKVEQGEVEPFQHQPPEREVGIARESVSVAQHDTRPGRVAVAHHAYRRAVVHRKVEGCGGFGQNEPGRPPPGLRAGQWRTVHLTTIPAAGMVAIGSRLQHVKPGEVFDIPHRRGDPLHLKLIGSTHSVKRLVENRHRGVDLVAGHDERRRDPEGCGRSTAARC